MPGNLLGGILRQREGAVRDQAWLTHTLLEAAGPHLPFGQLAVLRPALPLRHTTRGARSGGEGARALTLVEELSTRPGPSRAPPGGASQPAWEPRSLMASALPRAGPVLLLGRVPPSGQCGRGGRPQRGGTHHPRPWPEAVVAAAAGIIRGLFLKQWWQQPQASSETLA